MRSILLLAMVAISFTFAGPSAVHAQTAGGAGPAIISKFRVEPKGGGVLFVTINGQERQIVKEAQEAWIIDGGQKLAYRTSEAPGQMGAGGTIYVYIARTGQHKKLVTSEDDFADVKIARSGDGKTVLLLETSGAENCVPKIGVIDPTRGEIFSQTPAKVLSIKGDTMTLGYFKEAEWQKNCESKKMKAYKTKTFSLSVLLKRTTVSHTQ